MPSIRQELRRARRALTARQQRDAAAGLASVLVREPRFVNAQRIAFYLPNDGEIDPTPALLTAALLGRTCYLPVITDRLMSWRPAPLAFQQFDPVDDGLAGNRFNIPEPRLDPKRFAGPGELDLVLVPLVGFDRFGNRLGMGQGFYDRTLATMGHHFRRPRLLGLAHSLQESDTIETNAWDIPLHGIATEQGLSWVG